MTTHNTIHEFHDQGGHDDHPEHGDHHAGHDHAGHDFGSHDGGDNGREQHDGIDRHAGARRERPLGHLAAVVSHHTRAAMKTALAEAGISRRDLRLLTVLEREPQTAEALLERRNRRAGHGNPKAQASHGEGHPRGRGRTDHASHGPDHREQRHHERGHHGHGHKHVHLSDRLARLEEEGLLRQDASGILSITERGAEVRRAAREALAAVRERSRVGISDDDLETTRRTLAALAENLAA